MQSLPPRVPPKIEAAQNYLAFFHQGRGPMRLSFDGAPNEQPEPSAQEKAVYKAALTVLSQYFMGEIDFADTVLPVVEDGGDDDQPQSPVVVG